METRQNKEGDLLSLVMCLLCVKTQRTRHIEFGL